MVCSPPKFADKYPTPKTIKMSKATAPSARYTFFLRSSRARRICCCGFLGECAYRLSMNPFQSIGRDVDPTPLRCGTSAQRLSYSPARGFRNEGQQCDVTRAFDRGGEHALMARAGADFAARFDLA